MPIAITGAATRIGYALSTAFDTPLGSSALSLLYADSLTHSKGVSTLTDNGIGAGAGMLTDADAGAPSPSLTIPKKVKYDDQGHAMLGQFMGSEVVFSAGSGAYLHSFPAQVASAVAYGTLGFQATSSDVIEAINAVVTKATFELNPNDYIQSSFDLIATDERVTGGTSAPVNTFASLNSATAPVTKNFITRPVHYVRINAQAGAALANSDKLAATSVSIELTKEMELVGEIRGAAGFGAPRFSGAPVFGASVTVNFKNLDDVKFFLARDNATEYKMDLQILGDLIGGTNYNYFACDFPRLKVVSDPDHGVGSPGENPYSVTFQALFASSAPSGMASGYPMPKVQNTRVTRYLP